MDIDPNLLDLIGKRIKGSPVFDELIVEYIVIENGKARLRCKHGEEEVWVYGWKNVEVIEE